MRAFSILAVLVAAVPSSGCVALPVLAPVAASAGGDLVKAGTVRVRGATHRTFSVTMPELYQATRKTLDELGFATPEEELVEERVTLRARGIDRTVRVDLQPITGALTQMRVSVRKDTLGKDEATASEFVAQAERVLAAVADRGPGQRKIGQRRTPAR